MYDTILLSIPLATITEHIPRLARTAATALSDRHNTPTTEAQRLDRCSWSMTRTCGVGLYQRAVSVQRAVAAGRRPLQHALRPLGVMDDASFRNDYSYSCSYRPACRSSATAWQLVHHFNSTTTLRQQQQQQQQQQHAATAAGCKVAEVYMSISQNGQSAV